LSGQVRETPFYCDHECYALHSEPTAAQIKNARQHREHFDQMKAAELTHFLPVLGAVKA